MALSMPVLCLAQNPAFDGFVVYNSINQTTARLINASGQIVHTWACPSPANYAMALRDNGNIVRGAIHSPNFISGAAVGGKVQELNPQAQVVWEFVYSTQDHVTHHDLCLMPNGNVLLIAWVKKTLAQLQALGYTGNTAKYPGRIIEIQPTGTTAQVVWEWNMEDRFIQFVDPNKPNYMPIADHPERMNINVPVTGGGFGSSTDWFHENGIDYNPDLDQIAFSSRYLNEIFIIDHSTTTLEAAGHTAGNAGRGGDFLFRWGKPSNYGVAGSQTIAGAVHDVRWVKPDRPNEGWLMFVNNVGGPGGSTVIDAIDPVRTGYTYPWTPGTVWGPTAHQWRHQALANASGQSACDRMPNGNTFVALSGQYMYEVNDNNQVVWQYNAGPAKAFRYLCDDPGIIALLGPDPCGLATAVPEMGRPFVAVAPNPTDGEVEIMGLATSEMRQVTVTDALGREVLRTPPTILFHLGDQRNGTYLVTIELQDGGRIHRRVLLQR